MTTRQINTANLIIVMAILIGGFNLSWLHAQNANYQTLTSIDQWQQTPLYPESTINFSELDAHLLELPNHWEDRWRQPSNKLSMIKALSKKIPANAEPEDLKRIAFLIKKTLPSESGRQLAALSMQYYKYQQEYDQLIAQQLSSSVELKKNIQLQQRYFQPELAAAFFNKKNRLTQFLIKRKEINNDPSLSVEKRAAKLKELENQYNQLNGDP